MIHSSPSYAVAISPIGHTRIRPNRPAIVNKAKQPASNRLTMLGKLFIAILLITIFEGALRKWVSNSLTYPLVGSRDVLAAYGVLWALVKNQTRHAPRIFQHLALVSIALVVWGALQLLINQTSTLVYVLGLRFWLLYLWFAVLAGIAMTEYDFKIIAKLLVLLLIAMAPLAVMQHFLPPSSFWNKQVDESFIFQVSRGIVRTTGTFSFTMGYTTFLAMASPFVFMSLDVTFKLWQTKWLPILAAAALLAATVVSGSRGAIIFFGLLFITYVVSSIRFAKGRKKGQSILVIAVVLVLLVVAINVFSRAADATRDRFEAAHRNESPIDRIIYTFAPQGEIPFLGEGIGMGNHVAAQLLTGKKRTILAESENARLILEAGLLGLTLVLLKMVIIWRASRKALRMAKYSGSVTTVMIWGSVALALLTWPLIGQLTVNSLGFLLFGLGIAALRLERMRLQSCR